MGSAKVQLIWRNAWVSEPIPAVEEPSQHEVVFLVLTDLMGFPANADEVKSNASEAFDKWGGNARLKACRQELAPAPH